MGIFRQFPYSNFHDMNMDTVLRIMREMQDEWAATKTEWASYKEFIDNYFANLNLDAETEKALRKLISDGTLDSVIDPVIIAETARWLAEHISQPTVPVIDASLSIAGAAADAKAAGDAIRSVNSEVDFLRRDADIANDILCIEQETYKLINGYNSNNNLQTDMANAPFIYHAADANFSNCLISKIRLNISQAGTLSIGTVKKSDVTIGAIFDRANLTIKDTVNIVSTGLQEIPVMPFIVEDDEYLFIGNNNNTARWLYGTSGTDKSFIYIYNNLCTVSASSVGVDIYAYTSASALNNLYEINRLALATGNALGLVTAEEVINGYSPSNTTNGSFSTAPYVPTKNVDYDYFVTSIQVNVARAGTITFGTIKKTDVLNVAPYDKNNLKIHEVVDIARAGVQNVIFKSPLFVPKDEYIFFGVPEDTARQYYGSEGSDTGFRYVNDAGVYRASAASINLIVNANVINNDTNPSIYRGKTLSILGDSISTFAGYIPSGNVTYYPGGTVQAVSDTWWYKMLTALGMELDTNNSWSGSRVTTTDGETSAGCMARCQDLGTDPDVIIVWMGINDFNNEVDLGSYDGTTALPADTTKFREAYAIMLDKILTAYPAAEVWVCTLPQCERNADTGFPEINANNVALFEFNKAILELAEAFGVKVLDHNKCGLTYQNMAIYNPDNLHPNKYGHSLIANNDIKQMDAVIRTRYPIA